MDHVLSPLQVHDDLELLNLMLEDSRLAPEMYLPTNYWNDYVKVFLKDLKRYGLKDFRRRENSILSTFGGTDIKPKVLDFSSKKLLNNHYTRKIPLYSSVLGFLNTQVNKLWMEGGGQ